MEKHFTTTRELYRYTSMEAKVFTCEVWWENMEEEEDDVLHDKKLFELSILGYISTFNSLPIVGFMVKNGSCDDGKIEYISYDGISRHVSVKLDFT